MKKNFIIPILIVLLTGIGCTCKNISKTKDTTMDEQLKKHGMVSWSELMIASGKFKQLLYQLYYQLTY